MDKAVVECLAPVFPAEALPTLGRKANSERNSSVPDVTANNSKDYAKATVQTFRQRALS